MLPPNGNFMTITLFGADPVEAAATLDTWIAEFESTATRLKRRNVSEYSRQLETQRQFASDELKHPSCPSRRSARAPSPCPPRPRSRARVSRKRAAR